MSTSDPPHASDPLPPHAAMSLAPPSSVMNSRRFV
jgi:hypothetical protein